MRKVAIWLVSVVGVGLLVAPAVFNMWVRAPRGAEMISDFTPYMTHARATQYEQDYLPAIAVGFGGVPQAVSDASARYGDGVHPWSYSRAASFLQSQPSLSALSYVQRNFPTMAAPISNMVGVMVRDVGDFKGVAGLPPFWLFPLFFVLPGLILLVVGVMLLRRERASQPAGRVPQWIALIIGAFLVVAPFAPMPPGWVLMWLVTPGGAHMIDDFAGPANGMPGSAAIMSDATANQFNSYLSYLNAGHREIVPAVQAVAAQFGQSISAAEAQSFIAGDPKLAKVNDIVNRFPTMYASFHGMLTVMAKDVADYEAVRALPRFTLFPWFFIIPGLIVAVAAALILGSDSKAGGQREYGRVNELLGTATTGRQTAARERG
ncbi:MAG: hypothetical protein JOZ75_10530 [Candidatus Dormibacteraeota bacterium]|nr:hypothetical protein [Candidatus Dormibacteraeota bacterium]